LLYFAKVMIIKIVS